MLIFVIWFLFIPESYLYCLDLYMNCGNFTDTESLTLFKANPKIEFHLVWFQVQGSFT